jgi:hypothetical protein
LYLPLNVVESFYKNSSGNGFREEEHIYQQMLIEAFNNKPLQGMIIELGFEYTSK